MTKTITTLYSISHRHKEAIFIVLISSVFMISCAYVFFLQKAIINVVQREKTAKDARDISASVNDFEGKYFSLKNAVTVELAKAKGLKEAEVTSYISKKSLTAMAVHNEL